MILTNGRQGDGVLQLANSGRLGGVKGAGVGSAYIDTTHRHHLLCTHTLIHTRTHTHLHSAMMSWQLRLVLYSSTWKHNSIRGWDNFANYATFLDNFVKQWN